VFNDMVSFIKYESETTTHTYILRTGSFLLTHIFRLICERIIFLKHFFLEMSTHIYRALSQ